MDLTLICCLVGSNTPFAVDIPSSRIVDHLKKMIKQEISDDLKGFSAHKLELFQISLPSGRDLAKRVKDAVEGIEPLDPTKKLFKLFPDEPPEETIHIAVKLPDDAGESFALLTQVRPSVVNLYPPHLQSNSTT